MPRVVIAPDKFKGTLPANEVADAIATGLRRVVPGVEAVTCPIADGGDGTVAAAVASGFDYVPATATGPTGELIETGYARRGETAVIELAAVSGLALLRGSLAPLTASTIGVGELIRAALHAGTRKVILGLGGSAGTDGGSGLLRGLGVRLLDADGDELPPGGKALLDLAWIDFSALEPRLCDAEIVVACDVDNPLLGEHGAAAVYGPQKGATPADVAVLEAALTHFARTAGTDFAEMPGAGAAGGTGYALRALLDAKFRPGIDVILELTGFADKLRDADLVITGEGSLDEQTLHGKGPGGIAARTTDTPVVAIAGRNTLPMDVLHEHGFAVAYALTDIEPDITRCMTNTAELLEQAAELAALRWL